MAVKLAEVCVVVAAPVSVTVTLAVAVAVFPADAYCTVIVQLFAGLRSTVPAVQVPPVMENVPPAVPTLVMPVPVMVTGPAVAPVEVLVTVMVAVSVPVLAVVGASVGEGALKLIAPCVSTHATTLLVPAGVVTVTFLEPRPAAVVTEKVALMVVAFTTVKVVTVTPVPATFTAVAPVKLVPVRVTGTLMVVVPRLAEEGEMDASVGPCTVNVTVLVVPFGVTTRMDLAPADAFAGMVQPAVTVVKFGVPVMAQVTAPPVPPMTCTAVAPVRSLPVRVTATGEPAAEPEVGLIDVSEGPSTVNVTVAVKP